MVHELIIAGVKTTMDTFFHLKEAKGTKVLAEMTVNKVMFGYDSIALNISIINKTDKPFSVINSFMKRDQQVELLEGCRVNSIDVPKSAKGPLYIQFNADMFNCRIDKPEGFFNLEPFNIHAYLLENQAETGWILFKVKPEQAMFSSFGIKLSGSNELLLSSN